MSKKRRSKLVRKTPKPITLPRGWSEGERCPDCIIQFGVALAPPAPLIDGLCRRHRQEALAALAEVAL